MAAKTETNPVLACGHCLEYERLDRRTFIASLGAPSLWLGKSLAAYPAWMPRVHLAAPHIGPRGDTLVAIFLRGGADGLNIAIPHGDEHYYSLRPTIGVARPDDTRAEFKVADLDGFFGLHPSLSPLVELYRADALAVIHATGAPDETRSHFEAMAFMERGATTGGEYSGWLARHLATLDTGNASALRAVAIGEMLPASLTGTVNATALQSIGDYHLQSDKESAARVKEVLAELYRQQNDLLSGVAEQTLASIEVLSQIDIHNYQPTGRAYPEGEFGMAMQAVAQLIRADVGVEVACVDLGGWDTHAAQGGGRGLMARNLEQLAIGLAAFYEDLQALSSGVTVVVMSEFGRRAGENAALGTDHGHGNMMLVMGGAIAGGQVFARWPGLAPEQLVGPGDLDITIDYRDVLGEILRKRLNSPDLSSIFPGYTVGEIGLAVARK